MSSVMEHIGPRHQQHTCQLGSPKPIDFQKLVLNLFSLQDFNPPIIKRNLHSWASENRGSQVLTGKCCYWNSVLNLNRNGPMAQVLSPLSLTFEEARKTKGLCFGGGGGLFILRQSLVISTFFCARWPFFPVFFKEQGLNAQRKV